MFKYITNVFPNTGHLITFLSAEANKLPPNFSKLIMLPSDHEERVLMHREGHSGAAKRISGSRGAQTRLLPLEFHRHNTPSKVPCLQQNVYN